MSEPIPGTCAEPGPWGAYCSDYPGHRHVHYDMAEDRGWRDGWQEHTPVEGGGKKHKTEES